MLVLLLVLAVFGFALRSKTDLYLSVASQAHTVLKGDTEPVSPDFKQKLVTSECVTLSVLAILFLLLTPAATRVVLRPLNVTHNDVLLSSDHWFRPPPRF
jgi:hypothetical protein